MDYLAWLQDNAFITWVRESESLLGYTLYLACHTIGLVLLVGPNLLIAARVLGLAPGLPIGPMRSLRPIMTVGLWTTVVTGAVLFATAPVGYVHNVVFIVKIAAIALAVLCLQITLRELFGVADPDALPVSARARRLMAATLVMWLIAVVAGRLTAYSGVVVIASIAGFLSLLAIAAALGYLARLTTQRRGVERRASFHLDIEPAKGGE